MAKIEPVVNVNSISRISAGTVIKGEILSPNDIRIDGTFEGRIQSKGRVVVGESATIKGDIVCENVDLWGKVEGNIFVKDTLALKDGCKVDGSLHISRLSVESGDMIVEGNIDAVSYSEGKAKGGFFSKVFR